MKRLGINQVYSWVPVVNETTKYIDELIANVSYGKLSLIIAFFFIIITNFTPSVFRLIPAPNYVINCKIHIFHQRKCMSLINIMKKTGHIVLQTKCEFICLFGFHSIDVILCCIN